MQLGLQEKIDPSRAIYVREPEKIMQREQRQGTRRTAHKFGGSLRQVWGVMQEMSRMLEAAHSAEVRPAARDNGATRHWEPLVTEMPAGDDLIVYFELPDVEREDIDLALHGNSIVVSGVRKDLPSLEHVTVEDFASGDLDLGPVEQSLFKRSVDLPGPAAEEEVEAAFGAGLLQVRVVRAGNSSRRIHIRGGRKHRS